VIKDRFVSGYVGVLTQTIDAMKNALATGLHKDLYEVGKLQGQIIGLQTALRSLESCIEEDDQ
jgi:hypothetical protein